jgi:hypothetical protein
MPRNIAAALLGTALFTALPVSAEWPVEITPDHRPGAYWWCPGSALDRENIDWNLETMREAGFGLAHLIPIYGARGYEDRYIDYLSDEWMAMLDHAVEKAESLGMHLDMTTGTGWCFGGPDLAEAHKDTRVEYRDGKLNFIRKRMVKRAAPGGEGAMLDPFNPEAMKAYLERFTRAFEKSNAAMPRAQYHDSFEYQGTWSDALLPAFREARGYDLEDHLDLFFNEEDHSEERARLKYDYRLTLEELHLEFLETWADWARQRGMLTRNEAHGGPYNLLDAYAVADIPETEMFGSPRYPIPGFRYEEPWVREPDNDRRVTMLAASAAHVAKQPGRQQVCSESCTWLRNHWHTTLGQIKLQLDEFFLAGVNHMLYHGTCYAPADAPWPGWFFYAAVKADPRNAFWRDMPLLNAYIARAQSLLQAGRPDNDVLLYWPLDDYFMHPDGLTRPLTVHNKAWMSETAAGDLAEKLLEKGFAFDFISGRMLDLLEIKNGAIHAPGGVYQAIAVPECRYMPSAAITRLADLAGAGAVIRFEKDFPRDVPGLADLENRHTTFNEARSRLESAETAGVADDLPAALSEAGIQRETLTDAGLEYLRRHVDGDCYYFVVNQTADRFDGWLPLARSGRTATLYDPMTGKSGALAAQHTDKGVRAYLQLHSGESAFIRLGENAAAQPWPLWEEAGNAVPVEGEWRIEFIGGAPECPEAYTLQALECWTKAPDPRARAFAGTALYTIDVDVPDTAGTEAWRLDLGDVRESARVRVNGQDAGFAFAHPFHADVSEWLKPGANRIEIEVTNLSANRMRDLGRRVKAGETDDWKIMRDINIVNVDYKEFTPAKWPLQPSGLLGPVELVPLRRITPEK